MNAAPTIPEDIAAALRDLLPSLSSHTAHAATYLLDHPQDVAVTSMRELARRADVPPVTFVRIAQKLGLNGWVALRDRYVDALLQANNRKAITRNADSARAIIASANNGPAAFAEAFLAAEKDVLDQTFAFLDEGRLSTATRMLASARHIYVTGRRTSFPAAYTLAYALLKARSGVLLLSEIGGAPEAPLEGASADDVFVAFSFSPFSRTTDQLARRAAMGGARLIVVSDSVGAPLRKLADPLLFIAPSLSRAFPETVGGALAFANLLAALTVAELGEKGQQRIFANEEYLVQSGEYIGSGRATSRKRSS